MSTVDNNGTLVILQSSYSTIMSTWKHIPGSVVTTRYIRSSHRDDLRRTILEVFLIIFTASILVQSRMRAKGLGNNFVKLSERVSHHLIVNTAQPLMSIAGNRRARR